MRPHTLIGCAGAAVLLAAALVLVRRPAREVGRYRDDMTARLRALEAAQTRHRERAGRYAASSVELGAPPESSSVQLKIEHASDSGWSASASHPATSVVCRVWVGRPRGFGREGEPRCE